VATGFEPDVLVIDEALAVGDQSFQKKCTDRILDFRDRGVTILFCSHNLHQVRTLCDRAIWLEKGRMMGLGPASEVVDQYNSHSLEGEGQSSPENRAGDIGGRVCWIESARLRASEVDSSNLFKTGDTLRLDIQAHFKESFRGDPGIAVSVVRNDGTPVYVTSSAIDEFPLRRIGPEKYSVTAVFPELSLLSGKYHFSVAAADETSLQAYDTWEQVEPFIVRHDGADRGLVRLSHFWEVGADPGE
jgi:lipopolysaccharide transport system ATP-binding protein